MSKAKPLAMPSVEVEIWKDSDIAPGYIVSNHGRIAKINTTGDKVKLKVSIPSTKDSPRRRTWISHMVLDAFVSKSPYEHAVSRHLDGDDLNNRADNLEWWGRETNFPQWRAKANKKVVKL